MDVVSNSPLRVASIIWQPRAGAFALTVLCKATFLLTPGEAQLAPEQEGLTRADEPWGGDPSRSLRAASDLAPMKPRADVLLVGSAFAPNDVPVRSLVVRMVVGEIDKSMEVWCTRLLGLGGAMQEGAPFTKVPLAYELAGGGPGTVNPVGMRVDARDTQGRIALPNLQPVAAGESIDPIGFGPIAPHWPERVARLGPRAAEWNNAKWYRQPIPEGVELAFFNVAPADQQLLSLRDDEAIVLENLHPDIPHLVTRLPGLRPRVTVEPAGVAPFELPVRADTLAIDTDRAICTVVFRGHFPVDHPLQQGRVVVDVEMPPKEPEHPRPDTSTTVFAAPPVSVPPESVMPFMRSGSQPPPPPPPRPSSRGGLPFAGSGPLVPPPPPSVRGAPTAAIPVFPSSTNVDAPPPVVVATPKTEPPPPIDVTPEIEPPPVVATPKTEPPPPVGASVSDPPPASMPRTIGEMLAARAAAPPEPAQPPASGLRPPEMLGTLSAPAPDPAADAGSAGVLAASNAALGPGETPNWTPPRAAPVRAIPDDIEGTLLQIVWFDRDSVAWMRRREEWKPILAELEKRPPDPAFDDPVLARDPAEIEDRREVFEILLRAAALNAEGLRAVMNEGMRPDGKFIPALVMLSGEIEFPFDEVEALKATIPTASWFAGAEDPLLGAIEAAIKFLATPGHPSGTVAEGYTDNIKKAFKQRKRNLEYLEGPAERTLLERRAYQRRPVLGGPHLRALFTPAGAKYPVPVYFPEPTARQLPMYRRFRARIVAETHLPVDQYETHPAALRAAALGRVLPATKQ